MSEHFLYAKLLDGKGGCTDLTQEQVLAFKEGDGILWVHFDYTNQDHRHNLLDNFKLPGLVNEALLASEVRPRTSVVYHGLLMSLRGVNLSPNTNPEDMISIRMWVEQHRIISTRRLRILSVEDIIDQLNSGVGPKSSSQWVAMLADQLVWRMSDTINDLEESMSDLEGVCLAEHKQVLRTDLAVIRKQLISLKRYLSPQKDALLRLSSESISWFDEHLKIQIREVTDRLLIYLENIDEIKERAVVVQEELQNSLSDQMNTRMYVLSMISAIFLPLGFLTGLLGINVGGLPGVENSAAFTIFSLGLGLLTLCQILFFKFKKWL
ncbi:zinc transporter ZntB [Marinicellulosiphila megalodicopiae]|uniref:zinc transporter ZntB n=1 Tax=Marinicellulosiphila megalodicopiae TaxID=2724896 RepID=UPI003BAF8000